MCILQRLLRVSVNIASILLCFALLCLACNYKQHSPNSNSGVFINQISFYDSSKQTYISGDSIWPETKVWYWDSMAVELKPSVIIEELNGEVVSKRIERNQYVFIDLKNKDSYVYRSFSDTAQVSSISKFGERKPGEMFSIYGVEPVEINVTEKEINLPDTTIGNVQYKRIKYVYKSGKPEKNRIIIAYLRCDKKGFQFPYYKKQSEICGCPITMMETSYFGYRPSTKLELIFIADSLKSEEKGVFEAWKKNQVN